MLFSIALGLAALVFIPVTMSIFRDLNRVVLLGSRNEGEKATPAFDPSRDIPSLVGKVILITGAAGDLGRQTAIDLARHGRPARIYIADLPREDAIKQSLAQRILHEAYGSELPESRLDGPQRTTIKFTDLDLSSFQGVRKCVADVLAREDRLDILILNAGVLRVVPERTVEGYEVHFGVNYLGHALLARLLVPLLLSTKRRSEDDVRIVIVSSEGHHAAPKGGVDLAKVRTDCADLQYLRRYGQSKVALIGLMKSLTRRHPELTVLAIHPGRIFTTMASSLGKDSALARWTQPIAPLFCVPLEKGIWNHLWAATSKDAKGGHYYEPVGSPGKLSAAADDEELVGKLEEWTDGVLGRV